MNTPHGGPRVPSALPVSRTMLPGGVQLVVRPIAPRDRWRLRWALMRPGEERCRMSVLAAPGREGGAGWPSHFRLDPPNSVYYVAIAGRQFEGRIVGICGWRIAKPATTADAEMVIGLLDGRLGESEYSREIARVLFEGVRAAARLFGIERLRAYILPEDLELQDLFEHSGVTVHKDFARGCYEYSIPMRALAA